MYKKSILTLLFITTLLFSDTKTSQGDSVSKLNQIATEFQRIEDIQKKEVVEFATKARIPLRKEFKDGSITEIIKIKNGIPLFYSTHNENAAISTRTNYLWSEPFSITGVGYTNLGEWDGGAVRGTHDELTGRVTQVDGASSLSNHATHVAGTLIASGYNSSAKGMAYDANLSAYDWTNDNSEMATAASNGMEVSNHSYGFIRGWHGSSSWYGNTSISQDEVYQFGFYSSESQAWDNIAYNAPNYLIVKSAGNDRNDYAPAPDTNHTHNGGSTIFNDSHFSDGFDNGGYDTISEVGIAKNILTVGAVNDVAGYVSSQSVSMSSFSGWGPADDGRIKPDIVGNGVSVYSSVASSDSAYSSYNGTSMASPNVTGTLALLQQYYKNTHSGSPMHSATLKALVLHSADEAGQYPGPDYKYGWGLLNAKKAAEIIKEDETSNIIDELTLLNGGSYTREIELEEGLESLKVTIVWTDPAGTPVAASLDPTDKMLVNDLNLKITKDGITYYPWKLDVANPSNAATNIGLNDVDNVEQVYIPSPQAGTYTITVEHIGTLASPQNFSIILGSSQEVVIKRAFFEDFETASIPATWSVINNIAASVTWDINTNIDQSFSNYTGATGTCAGANSDKTGTKAYDTELRTPTINLSSYTSASLSFFVNYQDYSATDFFKVDISTDGGLTFTNVLQFSDDVGTLNSTPGQKISIDLTSLVAGQKSVMIKFHYYNLETNAYDWYVEIDDVTISGEKEETFNPATIMYLLN